MSARDLTPSQRRNRERFEAGIALAAPVLDAILAVGERISRIAEPVDHDHYPVRAGEAEAEVSEGRPGEVPAKRGATQ